MRVSVRVATWSATGPFAGRLVQLRKHTDPQRWRCVLSTTRPDGQKDEHTIRADRPCSLRQMAQHIEASVAELCSDTPAVVAARMDFYA